VSPGRRRLLAVVAGISAALFLFAVPEHGSLEPMTVGLAMLLGPAFGLGLYWGTGIKGY
jgi:hypothetical protein